ncbi:HYD1 signature containing ADP-ribosyltransferase family protein [Pseudomonas fluorescens]|nr:HYD1 signature containing ADP-ribosyltransferase family protein [Pseudomonas fluorescens]
MKFSIEPLSAFGRAYDFAPGEQVSVAWFLRENKLYVPADPEQLVNLIDVSHEPIPEQAELGNHWGLLSQSMTLDTEQRTKLRTMTKEEMAKVPPGNGTFAVFHRKYGASVLGKNAGETLEKMVASPELRMLGQQLEAAFNTDDTPMSSQVSDWIMAAMVLELDPQAGSKRGVVAGYSLYQPANWGVSPSVVVERLSQHLIQQGKVNAQMAPAAARLLLAGAASEFIVADIPNNLVVGSAAFARLSTVVETQEILRPGVASVTDFQAFMKLASHSPVSEVEAGIEAKAQSHALIEWGVAQGRVTRKDHEAYRADEVAGLRDAFNAELAALKKAEQQLSANLPNRKAIAIEQLKAAYGSDDPFDVRTIRIANIDASESEYHSLLDIYMAGKMDRILPGERYDFRLGNRFLRVKQLADINQLFSSQFDSYFKGVKEGVATSVKHQLSTLPLEDRQTIASGKVEFFSLRKASLAQAEGTESAAEAQEAKARFGLLMRVESRIDKKGSSQDYKNLRYVYYEVFPLQGIIRRRDDLPRYLPNPAPRVAGAETYTERQAKGVSVWVDYEAYRGGTPAQLEKFSGGLLTERVKGPYLPEVKAGQVASASVHTNLRFDTIGNVMADHLLHDREGMKSQARGVTEVEREEAGIKAGHDFVTGLIPFKTAIEHAVKGSTGEAIRDFALDIFGFFVPFSKGLGQAGKVLGKASEKLGTRAFKASDSILRAVASGLNPVDGVGDVVVGGAKTAKTVLQRSYRELKEILQGQNFTFAGSGKISGIINSGDSLAAGRQLPDLSPHSLPDSLLEGRTVKGDGTYQVGEQHYVRYSDGTGINRVFEISRVYKVNGGHVRVIDPSNQKTVAFLAPTGTGEWRLNQLPGGIRPQAQQSAATGISMIRPPASKRSAGQSAASGVSGGEPVAKKTRLPESFPGEKALLDPPVKGTNRFYHYTGEKPHAAITASRYLEPSSSKLTGEALPRGKGRHYFTDLAPEDMPTTKISETIFGRRKHGNALDKMTHYYEINTTGLNMVKSTENPHIFYVETPFSIPLSYRTAPGSDLTSRIISHGETPFTAVV